MEEANRMAKPGLSGKQQKRLDELAREWRLNPEECQLVFTQVICICCCSILRRCNN